MQRHTEQEIKEKVSCFFAPCGCRSRLFCIAYAEQTKKFSVLFGVLKNRRYYATKREKEVGKIQTSPWRKFEKNQKLFGRNELFWGVGNERKNEKFPKISVIFAFSCVVGSKGKFAALFGKFQNAVV